MELRDDQLLRTQIYDYIINLIMSGQLKTGQIISYRKISESLNIGRTPLREAILQLSTEGLVEIKPQRGVTVKQWGLKDMVDMFEVGTNLDGMALNTAFDLLTADDIADMEACHQAMIKCQAQSDQVNFRLYNRKFHEVYLLASKNKILIDFLKKIRTRLLAIYRNMENSPWLEDWNTRNTIDHGQLLDLIKAGDKEEAITLLCDVHWDFDRETSVKVFNYVAR